QRERRRISAALLLVSPRSQASREPQFALSLSHDVFHSQEAIRTDGNRANTMLDEEAREFGIIARRLAADPGRGTTRLRLGEQEFNGGGDGFVAFVEELAQFRAVAVDTEDELGEVV